MFLSDKVALVWVASIWSRRNGNLALRIRARALEGEASEHEKLSTRVSQALILVHWHCHAKFEPERSVEQGTTLSQ